MLARYGVEYLAEDVHRHLSNPSERWCNFYHRLGP